MLFNFFQPINEKLKKDNEGLAKQILSHKQEISLMNLEVEDMKSMVTTLRNESKAKDIMLANKEKQITALTPKESDLDIYCKTRYKKMQMIKYQQKRYIKDKPISVFLSEFICPEQFEVQNFARKIKRGVTLYQDAQAIGDYVAKQITWTSDKNLYTSDDWYEFPNETIVLKKGDCEAMSYLISSINPEIGIAYGFLNKEGHAFNVFVYNSKLYILDSVGDVGVVMLYDGSKYKINYILNRKNCYAVDNSVSFGNLVGWD